MTKTITVSYKPPDKLSMKWPYKPTYTDINSAKTEVGTPHGVSGQYSYLSPDGHVITNKYYADASGFHSSLAPTAAHDHDHAHVGHTSYFPVAPVVPVATVGRHAHVGTVAAGHAHEFSMIQAIQTLL